MNKMTGVAVATYELYQKIEPLLTAAQYLWDWLV